MCEHEPFALPDDAFNQEESAGVQLLDTERQLVYCCFCRKLLLPGRWPLLLSCLHSCCRECAVHKAKGVTVGNEAGGSSSSVSSVASAAALAESADAVRRHVADYLAMQRDSVLVRRRLSSAASAMFTDMPQCDACSSDAGSGATTSAKDNTAYERCDACSLNLCYDCRQWHDKFNSRHEIITLGTSESDASPLSRDMRPQCMHHAAALAVHRTSAATAADVFCASCKRLRCADCRKICVSQMHKLQDISDSRQHEPHAAATGVETTVSTEDARLAFDERLERLEHLGLPDIAMKVRQQARDSFKRAEDALANQKNAVLKELQKVRNDADDVARNIDEIESQLRPGVDLTRSYRNMLLSSASDEACVLDQKAVVLSRLDSMILLTDNAKDLLDKAGAVIKDGSQRKPVDLIEKMIERLQELQKQQQQQEQQQQPGQDDHDTGISVPEAASTSSSETNVRELSNYITEEHISPPTATADASHPTAQTILPQQQQIVDARDTVTTGSVRPEKPLPPSSTDNNAAFRAASTSSGEAATNAIGRNSSATDGRSSPGAVVQNAIDEGMLDTGGGFGDLSHQQQMQQQSQKQMQPPQQQHPQQQQPQQRPEQQQPPPQQQQPPQQQPTQQQPVPQQQLLPRQQQPPQQHPQPAQQQQQPAQHQQERQAQPGEQPQQMSASEPEVYRAGGRPTGSLRVVHDCRDVALAPNGHLLLAALKVGLIELDASGREVSRWTPPPTDEGQTDTASTVEVLCDSDSDEGNWRAVVGLMDSQSVVLLRRSNAAFAGNSDPSLLPPWTLEGEPIMLRAAPIRLSVCQPGLLAVAGANMSVTQESQQRGGKSKDRSSSLVVRRSWSPGPHLDVMQLADGQSRLCETLGYCIQGVAVTPRIVAALSNDTQRTDDGRQRYVIDAFCLITGRRLWRHGMDSEPSDLCTSFPQAGCSAVDVVLYAAMQHADRVVAIRARNGADAGELLSEQGNGVHVPFRITLAQIGLQTTVAVLTARREILLYSVS